MSLQNRWIQRSLNKAKSNEKIVLAPTHSFGDFYPARLIFYPNVRDHRWLPVARLVPVERSGTSTRRDAGSHSVDRIVRVLSFLSGLTPEGKDFRDGSASSGVGNRHLIEVYFSGVCVIAKGGIKQKPRFDRREYFSAKLTPLQWIRGKSCPLHLGRFNLGVILEKLNGSVC
jgi:hypothetical protein